jgi:hypothetical protein
MLREYNCNSECPSEAMGARRMAIVPHGERQHGPKSGERTSEANRIRPRHTEETHRPPNPRLHRPRTGSRRPALRSPLQDAARYRRDGRPDNTSQVPLPRQAGWQAGPVPDPREPHQASAQPCLLAGGAAHDRNPAQKLPLGKRPLLPRPLHEDCLGTGTVRGRLRGQPP